VTSSYHFTSTWELPFPAADAYAALYDLVSYPRWWPEFRSVVETGDPRGPMADRQHRMIVRSFLPYDLDYVLTEEIADEPTGVLQGWVNGDIVGRIRWDIAPSGDGCIVSFDEDVMTAVPLLNRLAPVGRPAFELNHRWTMHDGRVGLIGLLAGRAPVAAPPHGPGRVPWVGPLEPLRPQPARRRTKRPGR
jgi:hypothetical protein